MAKLQVLVVTMNQFDMRKYDEMNLKTDTLFANQANRTEYSSRVIKNHCVEMITTATRGVGKNRNIALLYASGDIVLLADDDIIYVDDYEAIILEAFEEIENADAIIFNVETIGKKVNRRINTEIKRVHFYNSFNYGAVRIAVRRKCLQREGITFNENFGGGTIYSAGEDSLFICEMLSKNLKIYTYPKKIAIVKQFESTWFTGYNRKFFYDKGALFYAISPRFYKLLSFQDALRHRKMYSDSGLTLYQILRLENQGALGYKKLIPFSEMD